MRQNERRVMLSRIKTAPALRVARIRAPCRVAKLGKGITIACVSRLAWNPSSQQRVSRWKCQQALADATRLEPKVLGGEVVHVYHLAPGGLGLAQALDLRGREQTFAQGGLERGLARGRAQLVVPERLIEFLAQRSSRIQLVDRDLQGRDRVVDPLRAV